MKKESINNVPSDKGSGWVDVHNNALMVELGIHKPEFVGLDSTIWRKSKQDKKILQTLRCINKLKDSHFHSTNERAIPVVGKLIIYLEKNNKYPNTTYSIICPQHKIGEYLSFYHKKDEKTHDEINLVSKYTYNGKTYRPGERPYWFVRE